MLIQRSNASHQAAAPAAHAAAASPSSPAARPAARAAAAAAAGPAWQRDPNRLNKATPSLRVYFCAFGRGLRYVTFTFSETFVVDWGALDTCFC